MKKQILTLALALATTTAMAQNIEPHSLEVAYDKTVHIIFPAAVKYVDLGAPHLIAGKAEAAENVVRVKSAIDGFSEQTNMAVITDDGNFYSFDVSYAETPKVLNLEMQDFLQGEPMSDNTLEVRLSQLGEESPERVNLILKSVYDDKRKRIKGINSKSFDVEYLLRSIYIDNGILYLHTELENDTNINFDVEFVTLKIVDRKVAKRTAMQEQIIEPLRVYNDVTQVKGKQSERWVYAVEKFTIPNNKQLVIEIHERNGGRHQSLSIKSRDLLKARTTTKL